MTATIFQPKVIEIEEEQVQQLVQLEGRTIVPVLYPIYWHDDVLVGSLSRSR